MTDIILIHGMARTPLSMGLLSHRLRSKGFNTRLFGYSPTLESFAECSQRLALFVLKTTADHDYALVGHSLGSVLIRGALNQLETHPPKACFFLAPPSRTCLSAKFFADTFLYRRLMGEMGQLLANEDFMNSLPWPAMPCYVYAGTGGPTGKYSPFGDQPNDGILTVAETKIVSSTPVIQVPSLHTFIMNSRQVAEDIANTLTQLN